MAPKNLRKGRSSVYFQHQHTGHSIEAEDYCCKVIGSDLVLSFKLRPAGGHQRDDEEYSINNQIEYIEIDDEHVLKGLQQYITHRQTEIHGWQVHISSQHGDKTMPVTPRISHIQTLQLVVRDTDAQQIAS